MTSTHPKNSSFLKTSLTVYLPPILWACLIFYLSSQSALPSFDVSRMDFIFKKSSHIFVYAVLYYLTFRAINNTTTASSKRNWWTPFLLCLIYAISDEIHQSFTPHRTPTARDVGYDMLGASISFLHIFKYI
jgi:VanZ family protein